MYRFPTCLSPSLNPKPMGASGADAQRRRLCFGWAGGALLGGCTTLRPHEAAAFSEVMPLSGGAGGTGLPSGWRPYIMRPDRVRTVYDCVRRDDRVALHAVADSAASGLACAVDIDPRSRPWLRWQWRVDTIDARATVADEDTEDTAARIVVAFDGDMSRLSLRDRIFYEQVELFTGNVLPFATLTYVWDGSLPVGKVLPYARSARIRYDVVESGAARVGQWLAYERNVLADYERVFGEPASGHVRSVGVLTDSDDLKTHAEAWYADIGLHARRSA
jgi:Protein of unknown function (DUF3047)